MKPEHQTSPGFSKGLACGRPLSSPASRRDGYGPVCRRKCDVRGLEPDSNDTGELFITPLTGPAIRDIELRRDCDGDPHSNIVHSCVSHSPTGIEWGYAGSGPADLALNILCMFVPPGSDGEPPAKCWRGVASATAVRLHQAFKWEFIGGVPWQGQTIPAERISEWLAAKQKAKAA